MHQSAASFLRLRRLAAIFIDSNEETSGMEGVEAKAVQINPEARSSASAGKVSLRSRLMRFFDQLQDEADPASLKNRFVAGLGLLTFGLIAFALAGAVGIVESLDIQRWLLLAATIAFPVTFAALRSRYKVLKSLNEKLRAELAQREARERTALQGEQTLRKIIDASLDVIVIFDLEDGRVLDVNRAFEIFGFTRDEAIGKREEELNLWADPSEFWPNSARA
jgi:PAS domain-containing protein